MNYIGNFSGPKQQEIVCARSQSLDLLRLEQGRIVTVCSTPTFAIVRSLITFRFTGANRDHLVIGSDSGKVSIMEFDLQTQNWKVVHCETYGKTGCRRIVPGQYLAADPKGRAIMIGAVEKQKFVYVLSRDANTKLTISSPLEAHKQETIVFSMCGVDAGYDNPIFAIIELEYSEADQDPTGEALQEIEKKLSYYELDLGLNHVIRKWSEPISRTANFLLSVPGGDNWPSGVLICGENWVSYKHQGHVEVRAPLPRRHDLPAERGVLIVTGAVHRQKDLFFFLLQSEYGDVYKVTFTLDESSNGKIVQDIQVAVFDTIPLATSLCITKTGFLFAASEFGNHYIFQLQSLYDPDAVIASRIADEALNEELGDDAFSAARVAPLFQASSKLKNLLLFEEIPSLAPVVDMLVDDMFGEGAMQLFAVCGRGNRSSLRTLRHGISVAEMGTSLLPGRPQAVWTIKKQQDDEYDRYVVVSFSNATLVLGITDNIEEEKGETGFILTSPTLQVALLADNAIVQVHSGGIRHIRPDKRSSEWKPPGKRAIQKAAINSRQVAISLSGGEITYFELDETGQLIELGTADLGKEVACMDLGEVPEGKLRSNFLAVGYWEDTVQLLTLAPPDVLGRCPLMHVDSRPSSISLIEMVKEISTEEAPGKQGSNSSGPTGKRTVEVQRSLYLNVGLERGVLLRVRVDPVTGDLSDRSQKYLGPKAVNLCRVRVQGQLMLMALSTRAWLMYNYRNRYHQDPLSYEMLDYVANITAEIVPDGIVAVAGNSMKLITIENLGNKFNQSSIPLKYTPRRITRFGKTKDLVIIEADHNEYSSEELERMRIKASSESKSGTGDAMEEGGLPPPPPPPAPPAPDAEEEGDGESEEFTLPIRGAVPPTPGRWASCLRIVEATSSTVKASLDLTDNEAAVSVCSCQFTQHSEEVFIIVGTCKGLVLTPKRHSMCYLHVYRALDGNLQLLHKTEVEEIPYAMMEFQGKLLVGVGRSLRLYDMGKKKLLKKCENKSMPTQVVRLQASGDRIYLGDAQQSVIYVKYRKQENTLTVFADDSLPRFITCMCLVDYATVACGDKFGNFFLLRLSDHANDDVAATVGNLWDYGLLHGAPNKLEIIAHYYLAEIPMSMTKCAMKQDGKEVLVVTTISGGIYAFVCSRTKDEISFCQNLEMFMRQEYSNVCQRDHLQFRSIYHPVKNVIDGSLCDLFAELSAAKQTEFCQSVDRSEAEVVRKLEEMNDFM